MIAQHRCQRNLAFFPCRKMQKPKIGISQSEELLAARYSIAVLQSSHVAQILGSKLKTKQRNVADSPTQSRLEPMLTLGSTKQPSANSTHVLQPSAHSAGPPWGDTFKGRRVHAKVPPCRLWVPRVPHLGASPAKKWGDTMMPEHF